MDVFAVFGLEPRLDIARSELEARYLELSRACHPDHHAAAGADERIALLTRAAEVNDAYRILRDPWQRAEALVERAAPGTLAATKSLDPSFLADALELAEEVANTEPGTDGADALRARLIAALAGDWDALAAAVERESWHDAAVQLHEARYHRKALRDLGP